MANLSSLPAELLLSVIEYVMPDDLFNFSITCRQLWQLAEGPIKEHKALLSQYGAVAFSYEPEGHTVWNILRAVVQNPRIAYYVHSIDMIESRNLYWDPSVTMSDEVQPTTLRPPAEQIELFKALVSQSEFLPKYSGQVGEVGVYTAIKNGSEGPIVALLLPLLLNLKEVIYVDSGDTEWLLCTLEKIAAAHATPNPPLAFRNLTTVSISHWDSEMCISYEWVRFFIAMPSMRTLTGHMVGGDVENTGAENKPTLARSQIKSLELGYSAVSSAAMAEVLSGIDALQTFEYANGGVTVDYADYDPHGILAALLKYASHSLEVLALSDEWDTDDDNQSSWVSLAGFQKLRSLFIDWDDLVRDTNEGDEENSDVDKALSQGFFTIEDDRNNDVRLVDRLPSSLKHLSLSKCRENELDMLVKMLEEKNERLPKLKTLRVRITGGSGLGKSEELAEAAKRVGVKYEQCR